MPHSLGAEQREHQVECCCNVEFVDQECDVLQRIVTGNESCGVQFDPE